MSKTIEEEEKRKSVKVLTDLIDEFLEGHYSDFSLNFERPLELSEKEYYELLGYYDSSGGAEGIDAFTYDCDTIEDKRTGKCFLITKKLVIERNIREADNGEMAYTIYKVEGYTDEIETDCNDEEG